MYTCVKHIPVKHIPVKHIPVKHIWQFRVEIKHYSVAYFGRLRRKDGAHKCYIDLSGI